MDQLEKSKVIEMAIKEFQEENFRAAIEREKFKLRQKKTFWQRIFPFEIIIKRRNLDE